MSDRMHRALAWLIAAVMVTAVATAPTVAQTTDPSAERVFEVVGLNADTVDGRHAIWATTSKAKRAKKLVATNKYGMLPNNIVKPKWSLIAGKPAGFADGVDNKGVTGITITTKQKSKSTSIGGSLSVTCPAGRAIGGGFTQLYANMVITKSVPLTASTGWLVEWRALDATPTTVYVSAICLSTTPDGALLP